MSLDRVLVIIPTYNEAENIGPITARLTGAGANPMNRKQTVGFTGTARIKRSDFNVSFAIPMVTDTVDLDITAAFEKQ